MFGTSRLAPWLLFSLACVACGESSSGDTGLGNGGSGGSGFGGSTYGGNGGEDTSPPRDPSGYLLITETRMAEMQGRVSASAPEWIELKSNVDEDGEDFDIYTSSPENAALVYLMTKQPKYADLAYRWAQRGVEADDVARDSYLYFGDRMREAAIVLNYCFDALSASQRKVLSDFLVRWTDELWYDNQGSGWGLEDPGNNYHMAFLEGTAFAGFALRQAGVARADVYLSLLQEKLEIGGGVLDYTRSRARGGDWPEGVNYGQRAKQRLYAALSVIASMGGPNYFTASPFFPESVDYAFYQAQPGFRAIHPAGDLPRDVDMPVTPYDREYLQMVGYWSGSSRARRLARWYLTEIVPDYTGPSFNDRTAYWYDLIFRTEGEVIEVGELPLAYTAPGTGFVAIRSGWDDEATSLAVSGYPIIDQSHQHHDVGSFTLWKHDWLAVDAASYSNSGLTWSSDAHNMVHVEGSERRGREIPGLQRAFDDERLSYVSVDATGVFTEHPESETLTLVDEYTRELVYLKPNTLIAYDRVTPKQPNRSYDFRVHFAERPSAVAVEGGTEYRATHGGGGITLRMLIGGAATITQDFDLQEESSEAYRVAVRPDAASNGRFLGVLEVASGAAPGIDASLGSADTDDVVALRVGNTSVAFSSRSFGAAVALPFSYEVSRGGLGDARTHVLCNLSEPVQVGVSRDAGRTRVTVSAGNVAPSDAGVVVVRE